MKSFSIAAALLGSIAAAVPLQEREVVVVTETNVDVVTVPVTKTVWVHPGESISAYGGHHHGGHGHGHHTIHTTSTLYVSSSPPETSTYAPPPPTTTYAPPPPTTTYAPPPPTTTYAPPPPTTTYAPPPPTTTYAPPPPSSAAPPPPASSSYSGGSSGGSNGLTGDAASGKSYSGDFTWYQVGLGACGITSTPSDPIVAVSEDLFDLYDTGNPNDNPLCGKKLTLIGCDGSPYTATIVDRCTGCALADLDLSEDFFNIVTSNGDGRVHNMKWSFD